MRLTDIKGEEALDFLADIMDPIISIMSDKEVQDAFRADDRLTAIKLLLRSHKKETIQIMAIMDGEGDAVEEYTEKVNILTLPRKLLELFNDPEVMALFTSQGQMTDGADSGPVTESTGETETK